MAFESIEVRTNGARAHYHVWLEPPDKPDGMVRLPDCFPSALKAIQAKHEVADYYGLSRHGRALECRFGDECRFIKENGLRRTARKRPVGK